MNDIMKLLLVISPLSLFSQMREPWMSKPKDEWPQIALTNNIQYKNGDRYIFSSFAYAGTGFLINTGTDTLAVTAKHILLIARNKKTNSVSINNDLLLWSMKPKGNYSDSVVIDKLINDDTAEVIEGIKSTILERDMLVLSIKKSSKNIYPLKPRYSIPRNGEKVYLIGCAYAHPFCSVN